MVFQEPKLSTISTNAFNSIPCTNARLHSAFLPMDALAKRINFVIVNNTNRDPNIKAGRRRQQAYRLLSSCTLTLLVNYTDFILLRLRPILFSIKTKPPSIQLELANLQISVWHAAH